MEFNQHGALKMWCNSEVAFPPIAISIDVTSIAPLTVQKLFFAVLIPWMAVLLIQPDCGGKIEEAVIPGTTVLHGDHCTLRQILTVPNFLM